MAQRIDATEGMLYSEFDTSIFSLTAIPVLGFWKLLPTFGGCVITASSAKMTDDHVIEMEVWKGWHNLLFIFNNIRSKRIS